VLSGRQRRSLNWSYQVVSDQPLIEQVDRLDRLLAVLLLELNGRGGLVRVLIVVVVSLLIHDDVLVPVELGLTGVELVLCQTRTTQEENVKQSVSSKLYLRVIEGSRKRKTHFVEHRASLG
jgi:hypothetical protein